VENADCYWLHGDTPTSLFINGRSPWTRGGGSFPINYGGGGKGDNSLNYRRPLQMKKVEICLSQHDTFLPISLGETCASSRKAGGLFRVTYRKFRTGGMWRTIRPHSIIICRSDSVLRSHMRNWNCSLLKRKKKKKFSEPGKKAFVVWGWGVVAAQSDKKGSLTTRRERKNISFLSNI